MLCNINYRGFTQDCLKDLHFGTKPCQCVLHFPEYTIIFFRNGKCRIMGCKQPIDPSTLPFNIINVTIQSITVTCDYGEPININALKKTTSNHYEPEMFPSLRLTCFNPICVNVFSSGKILITGLRDLNYKDFVTRVFDYILFTTM